MREKVIKVPIFGTEVRMCVTEDLQEVNRKYFGEEDAKSFGDAFTYNYFDNDRVLVAFKNTSSRVIVHECVHICSMILDKKGVKADFNNDETQAYLTDWLFNECEKFVNKELNKEKK